MENRVTTTYNPEGDPDTYASTSYDSSTGVTIINFNTDAGSVFLNGTTTSAADTIIHELVHAVANVYGLGAIQGALNLGWVNNDYASGNLIAVTEPDPNNQPGGTLVTSYAYNGANRLIQVTMPRSNGTQIRTFQWNGTDLTSATNPENGTVTYQYDGAHHVTLRTDAKGQQTLYTYDPYGRLTAVTHATSASQMSQASPDVNYYYDVNPFNRGYSQNAWGRLAAVTFAGLGSYYGTDHSSGADYYMSLSPLYMYSYNQAAA